MSNANVPLLVVPASIITYGLIQSFLAQYVSSSSRKLLLRANSGMHAAGMTLVAVLALQKSPFRANADHMIHGKIRSMPDGNLDDSENPIIREQSNLANAITGWETGYLIYDTWALVWYGTRGQIWPERLKSVIASVKRQPFEYTHHVGLITALLYLQYYIWKGNERGIWIIVALTLMNASTPLLHIRSLLAGNGKRYKTLDVAFAIMFALSRMGTISWILQKYGAHHGLNGLTAYMKLRMPCQAGTGAIFGLNLTWWFLLVRNLVWRYWMSPVQA